MAAGRRTSYQDSYERFLGDRASSSASPASSPDHGKTSCCQPGHVSLALSRGAADLRCQARPCQEEVWRILGLGVLVVRVPRCAEGAPEPDKTRTSRRRSS